MQLLKRFVSSLCLILVCSIVGILLATSTGEAQAFTSIQLSYEIPKNPGVGRNTLEKEFGNFAWQTFVALNWPADEEGNPLSNVNLGEKPDAPRVWEFYNFPANIFCPDGEAPNKLSQSNLPQYRCGDGEAKTLSSPIRLFEGEGDPDSISITLAKHNRSGKRQVLVDQNGNYVLNEIRINPTEVKQIVRNGWYSAKNLESFQDNTSFTLICSEDSIGFPGQFPCKENENVGAIELKAAWMILPGKPEEINSIRSEYPGYYTTTRTLLVDEEKSVDGTKTKLTVPVALIGFHIVHKTSQQSWIWATFEHKDNAPNADDLPSSGTYNLYNPNCKERNCEPNKPHAQEPYLWRNEFPYAVSQGGKPQTPSQITRVVPITQSASELNKIWENKLSGSIWENYQLIGTQWLGSPSLEPYNPEGNRNVQPNEGSQPSQLANVTLEPYVQTTPTGSSCIACHTFAYLPKPNDNIHSDFSFLFNDAQYSH